LVGTRGKKGQIRWSSRRERGKNRELGWGPHYRAVIGTIPKARKLEKDFVSSREKKQDVAEAREKQFGKKTEWGRGRRMGASAGFEKGH